MFKCFPIEHIEVAGRFRKDMGDLDALAASIKDVGLLQPILVSASFRLIAGQRRLEAVKRLGWKAVPVYVAHTLEDALAELMAERDENACRKNLTPSEAVAIGREIEELERDAAKKRQKQHGGTAPGKKKNTSSDSDGVSGRTDDRVSAAVGMGRDKYRKAKAVVEAAEKEPEKYGSLVDRMDETGEVNGAYTKLKSHEPDPASRSECPNGLCPAAEALWKSGKLTDESAHHIRACFTDAQQEEMLAGIDESEALSVLVEHVHTEWIAWYSERFWGATDYFNSLTTSIGCWPEKSDDGGDAGDATKEREWEILEGARITSDGRERILGQLEKTLNHVNRLIRVIKGSAKHAFE